MATLALDAAFPRLPVWFPWGAHFLLRVTASRDLPVVQKKNRIYGCLAV